MSCCNQDCQRTCPKRERCSEDALFICLYVSAVIASVICAALLTLIAAAI